jgi:hypothetical protein
MPKTNVPVTISFDLPQSVYDVLQARVDSDIDEMTLKPRYASVEDLVASQVLPMLSGLTAGVVTPEIKALRDQQKALDDQIEAFRKLKSILVRKGP